MDRSSIVKCQVDWLNRNNQKPSQVYVVPLLEKLTGTQLEQLQNGSGNPIAELFQVNSSAGLAVNYYKLLEKANKGLTVQFEWKESIPLLKSTAPANLDVRYEKDDTVYFIESKFLEPYCDKSERNSKAYFDTDRYPFEEHREEWKSLLLQETQFKYFDFAQICRHLLAIYRHFLENQSYYSGKNIKLCSVSWKMTDSFVRQYSSLQLPHSDMAARRTILEQEKELACRLINSHLSNIGWKQCSFETKNYNDSDMLDAIRHTDKFESFKSQYFL